MTKEKNENKLLFIKSMKNTLYEFINIFLVYYFFTLEPNTILPLAIYNIVAYITVFLVFFFLRNIIKRCNRMNIIRIGFLCNVLYFATIIILKENIINYVWLVGFFYGLEEGIFYSAYNILESSVVNNDRRAMFTSKYIIVMSIIKVLLPIIIGYLLSFVTYDIVSIVAIILIFVAILQSFRLKVKPNKSSPKCNIKEFLSCLKKPEYSQVKKIQIHHILIGLLTSGSALITIMSFYLVGILESSTIVGYSTAIFALFSIFAGFMLAKIIKPENYNVWMLISGISYAFCLTIFIFSKNIYTLFLYNIINSFCLTLFTNINNKNFLDVSCDEVVVKKFRVEYITFSEFMLMIGRVFGYILMILLGLYYSETFMIMIIIFFVLMMIVFTFSSSSLVKFRYKEFGSFKTIKNEKSIIADGEELIIEKKEK